MFCMHGTSVTTCFGALFNFVRQLLCKPSKCGNIDNLNGLIGWCYIKLIKDGWKGRKSGCGAFSTELGLRCSYVAHTRHVIFLTQIRFLNNLDRITSQETSRTFSRNKRLTEKTKPKNSFLDSQVRNFKVLDSTCFLWYVVLFASEANNIISLRASHEWLTMHLWSHVQSDI